MRRISLLLGLGLATGALAQSADVPAEAPPPVPPAVELTPPPAPAPAEEPATPVMPPGAVSLISHAEPQTGWARPGAVLGFGLSVVPVGLTVASVVASYRIGLNAQEVLLVCAGFSATLVALVPTLSGRSAEVVDDAAHRPRLFRIAGWVMIGFSAFGLISSPLIGRGLMLVKLSDGSPSVLGSTFNLLDAGLGTLGVVMISMASLMSARAAENSLVYDAARTPEVRVAPVVAFLPSSTGGGMVAGLAGVF